MKINGRWFPQIVDRDSGNLYPIYIKTIVVLASEPVGRRSRATELPCYNLNKMCWRHVYRQTSVHFSDGDANHMSNYSIQLTKLHILFNYFDVLRFSTFVFSQKLNIFKYLLIFKSCIPVPITKC